MPPDEMIVERLRTILLSHVRPSNQQRTCLNYIQTENPYWIAFFGKMFFMEMTLVIGD
jgi:hypothetical protein